MTPPRDITVLVPAAGPVPEGILATATISTPAMIPVAGRPVIKWLLSDLQNLGLNRARIALPERGLFAEDLIECVFGQTWDIDFLVPDVGGGVADTVLDLARGVTSGGVLAVLGDTLFSFADPAVLDGDEIALLVDHVDESYRWCLVETDADGRAIGFLDKVPDAPEPRRALVGVYFFPDVEVLHKADEALRSGDHRPPLGMSTLLGWASDHYPTRAIESGSWLDCGNPDTQASAQRRLLQQRAFNELEIDPLFSTITKRSTNKSKFIDEINYLRLLPPDLGVLFPRMVASSEEWDDPFITMEFYGYPTLAELFVFENLDQSIWTRIFNHLLQLLRNGFGSHSRPLDRAAVDDVYLRKTRVRLDEARSATTDPRLDFLLTTTDPVSINGTECASVHELWPWVEHRLDRLADVDGAVIHGDLCFTNILYELQSGICRLIDPRGSFGDTGIYGDPRYDVAKLNHSVTGLYDFIVQDLFAVTESGPGDYRLAIHHRPYHDDIGRLFVERFSPAFPMGDVDVITGLLFLSMIPLHFDSPERQVAFVLRGLEILNAARSNDTA